MLRSIVWGEGAFHAQPQRVALRLAHQSEAFGNGDADPLGLQASNRQGDLQSTQVCCTQQSRSILSEHGKGCCAFSSDGICIFVQLEEDASSKPWLGSGKKGLEKAAPHKARDRAEIYHLQAAKGQLGPSLVCPSSLSPTKFHFGYWARENTHV